MGVLLVVTLLLATPAGDSPGPYVVRAGRTRPAPTLKFSELLDPDPAVLRPSARALALDGQRVKLVGFMAQMTIEARGGFYLVPRPIFCDEAAGGAADLPPSSVRVVVPSAGDRPVAFTPRALEVTGVLAVGNRAEPDGHTSNFRLLLDGPSAKRRKKE